MRQPFGSAEVPSKPTSLRIIGLGSAGIEGGTVRFEKLLFDLITQGGITRHVTRRWASDCGFGAVVLAGRFRGANGVVLRSQGGGGTSIKSREIF